MTKTIKAAFFALAVPVALNAGLVIAAGDSSRGQTIATQGNGAGALACSMCHGPDGKGNDAAGFPNIAGLNAQYMSKQLHDYAKGTRKNPIMQPFASALSDEDIQTVTTYYQNLGSQTTAVTHQTADPDNQGEWLAMRGDWDNVIPACNQCHGPNGMGVGKSFPALAGQHSSYLKAQLNAWRRGTRDNDPNQLMKVIAERLSDKQISVIADYYAKLPGQLAARSNEKESR